MSDVDFGAAMHEVENNLEVRRLMVVLANVLTPACVMAITDSLSGADMSESLAWLPPLIMPLTGGLLLATGFLVTGVVARCHFGLVLNGTKMRKVETGELKLNPLNWLGVTTNFLVLTALSSALGTICLMAGLGLGWWAWIGGAATMFVVMLWLPISHVRANRRCKELDQHWQHGPVTKELRAEHSRKALDNTTADISVVVVMAVALFAGVFNALTNLGAIADDLAVVPATTTTKALAPVILTSFLLLSLLLSCRILVRLRLAFGQHSHRLATLRDEQDRTAMIWRPQERTYLLYGIVLMLAIASAVMLGYERADSTVAMIAGGATLIAGAVWYPLVLRFARRT
tara:strand:- start:22889 stop:23920 length:1032 start_codon:yes stop_codon:yes gene_type:complete